VTGHEWAYIDTIVHRRKRVKVLRCMHCRTERRKSARTFEAYSPICVGPITKILYVPKQAKEIEQ
jgi:hypothetical protein